MCKRKIKAQARRTRDVPGTEMVAVAGASAIATDLRGIPQ